MSEAKIKLRVDGAGSAKSDIKSVADTFDSLGDSAKGALSGLAAGLSAGALATWVKGAIDAADNLNDLSKSTSIAVEQLAGLDLAARQSGGNLDSIAQSINKLSVNIGKDAEKFAKIGITAKEPLEAFKQLADVYNSIQDPQQKAAFGAEALGKAWQGAAPLLAEGGAAIGEMVEKGTKLSGMTQDFADSSDAFNDSLAEMQTALGGAAARLGTDLLPLLNEVTTSLAGTSQEATDAAVAFNPITETFRALIVLGGNIAFVFKGVGTELGGVAAQIGALSNGEWKQAIAIGDAMKADAAKARETFDQWEANILNVGKVAKQTAKEVAELPLTQPGQTSKAKPGAIATFIGGDDSGAEKAKAEAERAIKARTSFIASLEKEYQTLGKTTEQNKLYEASLLGIRGRQLDLVKAKLVDIEAQKSLIKETERWDGIAKSMADEQKKYMDAMYDNIDSLKAQVEAQQEYNNNIGLSKDALIELTATKLEDAAAGKERNAQMLEEIGLETQQIELLRTQAEDLRNLAKLKREGGAKEAAIEREEQFAEQAKRDFEKLQDESQKFTDSLYEGLSDSLFRGFEDGKGFGVSMRDSIVNLFKTNAIKITAQVITTGILGFGAVGPASAGQSGGMLGDPTSLVSAGKSLYEGFTAAGTLGNGFLGSLAGGLQGAGAGSGLTSSLGLSIGNSIQSTLGTSISSTLSSGMSSIATAMPYAAAAAAAIAISKSVNGDYRLGGLSANQGALLGFAPRLFGMKEKELGGQTVTGTLGTQDLMRNQSWTQDGGLFRSDRSGVWSYGLKDSTAMQDGKAYTDAASLTSDKALLSMLNDTYASVKTASADYAKALGLNADSIASRADALSLTLGKTQEETQAAIQKTFGTIADSIAADLLPSVQSLAKENETASVTLARVALSFGSVNQAFGDLGLKLYDIGTAGYSAAANFTDLVGGIDAFKNVASSYYQNFYTQEERNANIVKSLTAELEKQNLILPSSRDGYRALVEEVSKTGSPEQLASLFKLSDAFASVFDASEIAAASVDSYVERMKQQSELIAQSVQQASLASRAERLSLVEGRRAAELAQETIRKASDDAFKTLTESVTSGMQNMLRAGKISAALDAQMSITSLNSAQYMDAGGFNAGAFNRTYAVAKAGAAKNMMTTASADALNVQDVSSIMGELLATIFDRDIIAANKLNLADQLQLPPGDLIRTAMTGLLDAGVQQYMNENSVGRGAGIASVLGAQMDYLFASFEGMGRDVVEYTKFVDGLGWSLDKGKISQSDYTSALEAANKVIGTSIDLIGNEVAQRERIAASQKAMNDAGLNSVSFYFNQISKSVESLNEAASLANTPLAQVSAGIGRLTSLSDVFSQSAKAALSGGANLGNGSLINAQIVAEAAAKAASVITTADAAQAAKLLGGKESFAGVGGSQLRDVSMILDGLKAFDSTGFEASFMRMNDALNKGTITQDQYQDIFATSLNLYNGVVDQQERELQVRTDFVDNLASISGAMKDFYNQLLIDPSKSTLSQSARMEEVMRQYDSAKIGLMGGDASRLNDFKSLAGQIADSANYSSRAEANYGYSRVLADSQMLGRYTERDPSAPQVEAIQSLEKSINERLDKQFAVMRSQLLELQNTRLNAARANLPTEVPA